MDFPWLNQQPNIGTSSNNGYSDLLSYLMSARQSPLQAVASAIPGVMFSHDMGKYNQPAANIAGAMTNLNNPLYQQLYGQFKQQGQQNLAQELQMMEGRNRSLAGMGRVPLFAPERNGEEVFRQMMLGSQNVQNNASQQALDQLSRAYTAANTTGQQAMQVGATKANVNSNLLGALTHMLGF